MAPKSSIGNVGLISAVTGEPLGFSGSSLQTAGVPSKVEGYQFQRPVDVIPYTAGDLIANSTAAASVVPLTFAVARDIDLPFNGRRVRISVTDAAWKGAIIRLHLFRSLPVPTAGDNGAFNASETYAVNEGAYIGFVDVTLGQQFNDPIVKGFATTDFIATPALGTVNIYGLLETRTTLTPGSAKTFSAAIEARRD